MKNINITEEYFLQHNKIKFSDTMHKDKNKKLIIQIIMKLKTKN